MAIRDFRPSDQTVFLLIGLASSIIIFLAYLYSPGFLQVMNLKATDAMFAARGAVDAPTEVVIVAVDEKSVNELGRWPWTRKTTAALVQRLSEAKVVAFDMVFSEPEATAPDRALSEAIAGSGNVILGYFFRDDSTEEPRLESIEQIKGSRVSLVRFLGEPDTSEGVPAIEFYGVETNTNSIGSGALGFGSFNAIPDNDGMYRTSSLLFKYKGEAFPSLSLKALEAFLGDETILTVASYGIDSLSIGGRKIPVNESGELSLNFYGAGGTFKTYPAVDVLKGRVGKDEFRDRLVFVGVTEKAVYDIRPTPVDPLFPGVEIHATIAGNVLQERFLIHDTRVIIFDLALIFILPAVLSLALSRARSTYISLTAFLGLVLILVSGDVYLFTGYSVKAGVVYPAVSMALAYMLSEAYRNIIVEKKSRYIKKAFSTYVSPELVAELIKDPDRLKLGGEKRVVTVLFSDIRGFTTLSERMPPERLVAFLNEYLSPMTGIVLEEEGMLDKYIGDAIMAVFNAPLMVPGHAKKACRSALKMIERLNALNEEWKGKDYPSIEIGVGINTGDAVVGNMGAELKFDYTAIGDTVNLASRLEGMNKLYGTAIVVSEYTYEETKDEFVFRELDLVRVKGKERPIVMYELLSEAGKDASALSLRDAFAEALTLFRTRDFDRAREAFKDISVRFPADQPARLYIKRCDEYIRSGPPEDWDGVFVAKTK